jgi:hypothetical protein
MDEKPRKAGVPICDRSRCGRRSESGIHSPVQCRLLPLTAALEGIDREIGNVSLRIAWMARKDPQNSEALRLATRLLTRMIRTRRLIASQIRRTGDGAVSLAMTSYLLAFLSPNIRLG